MKQVKAIIQDLNEIFIYFKRQEGGSTTPNLIQNDSICSYNGMPFMR